MPTTDGTVSNLTCAFFFRLDPPSNETSVPSLGDALTSLVLPESIGSICGECFNADFRGDIDLAGGLCFCPSVISADNRVENLADLDGLSDGCLPLGVDNADFVGIASDGSET